MKLFKKLIGVRSDELYLAQLAKIGITYKNPDGTYTPEFFYFIPRRFVVVKEIKKQPIYKDIIRKKKYKQISDKRLDSPGTVVIVDMKAIETNQNRIKYKDTEEILKTRNSLYIKK